MKQNLLLKSCYIIVATVWLLCFSCQSRNEEDAKAPDTSGVVTPPKESEKPEEITPPENPKVPIPEEIVGLTGTSWELVALVDEKTGEQTMPYCPQNARWGEACYTFTFDSVGAGFFDLRWRRVFVDFSYQKPVDDIADEVLIIGPESNYEFFYDMSFWIKLCSYEDGNLKFYCGDKKKYFLFKPLEERNISRVPVPDEILSLANTSFQLIGLMNAISDEIAISLPDDCSSLAGSSCYKFNFYENGVGHFTLSCAHVRMDFSRNPAVEWKDVLHTCSDQAQKLLDMAYTVDSCQYESKNKQLKLFCDNKQYYLLFKKIS